MTIKEKSIVMLSVMFGMLAIALGNLEQYKETQEFFGMTGILLMIFAFTFYLTITQERNEKS